MGTIVFRRGCRFDATARPAVEAEMERGRRYYNDMIGALNRDIAGVPARGEQPEVPGKGKRIERLAALICQSDQRAKAVAAKAIYNRIRRVSRDIRGQFTAAKSGCYTGTYHAVQADFDRAVSSKRVGVWPGEPYRYRRAGDSNTCVGVHIQPPKPWAWVRSGISEICAAPHELDDGRIFGMRLKVSKEATISLTVDRGKKCQGRRLDIPDDALVSHVVIRRVGDYGTKGRYEIHVTLKTPDVAAPQLERVGVDVGWASQPDGSMLVAVSSDGRRCVIPAYAVRMAQRVTELQSERDNLANAEKASIENCPSKSAIGLSQWIERNGVTGHAEYLATEHDLRCTQDHVRRRYQAIREDVYRKFANELRGRACIIKPNIKALAEEELKGRDANFDRTIASCFELLQLLRNAGAVEVICERSGDAPVPTAENAEKIRVALECGNLLDRGARKAVRKFRKRKRELDAD